MVNLYFQDLTYEKSYSLHEALLNVISKSKKGAGTYAFVTSEGIKLLFEDKIFEDFFSKNKTFNLIVGMDEVTNRDTINSLFKLVKKYENFKIEAFLHNNKNSLYHPKFSWFRSEDDKGFLIVGSGNLTSSGLRRNREIFNVIELNETEINEIELQWNDWLTFNRNNLKNIEDEKVLKRADLNLYKWKTLKEKVKSADKKTVIDSKDEIIIDEMIKDIEIENDTWNIYNDQRVNQLYIGEIPNASKRWSQANFPKESFVNYFGASLENDKEYRVLFKNVSLDGILGEVEIRPGVMVKSQNYRFELEAARQKKYPDGEERPIGIFLKIAVRMFLYMLLMPADLNYKEVREFLYLKTLIKIKGRMKFYNGKIEEFKDILEKLPLKEYVKEKNDRQ